MTERKEKPDRGQERSEIRRVNGLENQATMEDIRGLKRQSFPYQIFDFTPTHCASFLYICTYTSCILAAPTHPLHHTFALDSGSEARYVRRQSCGLGI